MTRSYGWLALVLASCGGASYEASPVATKSAADEEVYYRGADGGGAAGPPPAMARPAPDLAPAPAPTLQIIRGSRATEVAFADEGESEPDEAEDDSENGDDGGGDEVRRWFPEAFLWQPIVETDASGTATVEVRVPDTLTTWRVLALAHTKTGQQAGTVATFDSRLPLYVEPVVPGWLYAGDRIDLPVMVVNTTDAAVTAPLEVRADGALSGAATGPITLAAGGSDVRRVPITASGTGAATVHASLGDADAAVREIPVIPAGRPVEGTRGGLLSGPRTFTLVGPEGADPVSQELAVLVFPGPLAVVQAEVGRAASESGVYAWDAAYGYALAAEIESLAGRAGVEIDEKALRRLRILAWQRVVPHGRAPDHGQAADLLAAMRDTGDQEPAETMKKRLVRVVIDGQRADGTWARQPSAPLQVVIAQTAFAVRTLPEEETGPRLRAAGALERFAREIKDPYTASLVLASGVVEGDLAADLKKIIVDATTENAEGARTIAVPGEVLDPWLGYPSTSQVLAWSALALAEAEDVPWRGDLVSQLMGGYEGARGFGAGAADVIALEAVTRLLPGLDQPVTVTLTLDGKEVARQALDPSQPKEPAVLLAKPGARDPQIGLTVEPAVPGLVYVASLASWVPWTGDEQLYGVEVEVEAEPFRVGHDSTITLYLSAPSGYTLTVDQGLPAGVTVDELALAEVDGLVDRRVSTDRVTLETRKFRAGEVIEVPLVVRPAFAGRFSTGPLVVSAGSPRAALAPLTWVVAAESAPQAVAAADSPDRRRRDR